MVRARILHRRAVGVTEAVIDKRGIGVVDVLEALDRVGVCVRSGQAGVVDGGDDYGVDARGVWQGEAVRPWHAVDRGGAVGDGVVSVEVLTVEVERGQRRHLAGRVEAAVVWMVDVRGRSLDRQVK